MGRIRKRKEYRKSKKGEEDAGWTSEGAKGMKIVVESGEKKEEERDEERDEERRGKWRGRKGSKERRKQNLEGKGGRKREDNGRGWETEEFKEVRGTGKEEEGKGQNRLEWGRRERAE